MPVDLPPTSRARRPTRQRTTRGRTARRRTVLATVLAAALVAVGCTGGGSEQALPDHGGVPAGAVPAAASVGAPGAGGTSASITEENARPGTTAWHITDDRSQWDKIRGFASVTSVDRGGSFRLFVTSLAGWHVEAYRIGYYQGTGGRLIWTSPAQPGHVQAPPVTDKATGMREAHWDPSLDVTADGTWVPGMYMLKLVGDDGGQSFVPMVVRDDDSHADLLVQSSVTTWQAYNGWGGTNLYTGERGDATRRAKVVSFDRPYDGNGSGEFFGREYELVFFAERLGLDVTYWTDVDLHQQPQRVQQHHAVISLGHDEYYTPAMRTGLEQGRDHGVNVAFLGANAVFRKIRLEPSALGPDRHQVNYRDTSDPMMAKDKSQVTVSWRDAPSNQPESSLTGSLYECNPVSADLVVADAGAWIFDGTGLKDGDVLPDLVGNEYDRVTPERPTPKNIQVLTHSPLTCKGKQSFADATYYTTDSGAGVFDAATFRLVPPLDDECPNGPATGPSCQVQKMVENLLRTFAAGPAGRSHPSVDNLARFGIAPGYLRNGWPKGTKRPTSHPSGTTPPGSTPATTAAPTTTTTAPKATPSTTAPRTSTTTTTAAAKQTTTTTRR